MKEELTGLMHPLLMINVGAWRDLNSRGRVESLYKILPYKLKEAKKRLLEGYS